MSRPLGIVAFALGLLALGAAPAWGTEGLPQGEGPLCGDRTEAELVTLGPDLHRDATAELHASLAEPPTLAEDLERGRACAVDGASDDPSCRGDRPGAPTRHDPAPDAGRNQTTLGARPELPAPPVTDLTFARDDDRALRPGHARGLDRPPRG